MKWVRTKTHFNRHIDVCLEDDGVSKAILETGKWEPHVAERIWLELDNDHTFLDVGANLGYFSLFAADAMESRGLGGRVIAVEGNRLVLPHLMASVVNSGLDHIIEVLPYAVSDESLLLVQMNEDFGGNLGGTTIRPVEPKGRKRSLVPTVALDDVLVDLERLDLVKMDIEGAEYLAICGFEKTLAQYSPDIIMEINGECLRGVSSVSVGDMVLKMQSLGYRAYDLLTPYGAPLTPLEVAAIVDAHNYYDFLFTKQAY